MGIALGGKRVVHWDGLTAKARMGCYGLLLGFFAICWWNPESSTESKNREFVEIEKNEVQWYR
jgi:hypothetical protein